ncbi:hypothetical protein [Streptomyces sp. NPDC059909]|uniref:hypothetical protein n=1 Tax=Streptomyces sp. NPDC059909 TaxID=3346998 RepID=UPI003652006A
MPSARSRRGRDAFAVMVASAAVLFGVLLGTGTSGAAAHGVASWVAAGVSASAVAGAPEPVVADVATQVVADVPPSVVVAAPAGEHGPPGCDNGSQDDGGPRPAVPPRGSSSYELLPALHTAHATSASGCRTVDDIVLEVAPERGPPPVVAPSPTDLSVLRV